MDIQCKLSVDQKTLFLLTSVSSGSKRKLVSFVTVYDAIIGLAKGTTFFWSALNLHAVQDVFDVNRRARSPDVLAKERR